jgi:hypothetical protein
VIDIVKLVEAETAFDPETVQLLAHPLSKTLGIDFKNPAAGSLVPAIPAPCGKSLPSTSLRGRNWV